MSYRGPNARRITNQFTDIRSHAGEPVIWQQYQGTVSGNPTAIAAGSGYRRTYREQWITGLIAAPQMGEARFRETQLAGGQVIAGDAVISTQQPLGSQDQIVWRGVTYRIEGANTPIHLGGRLWYRVVLRRGDVTA